MSLKEVLVMVAKEKKNKASKAIEILRKKVSVKVKEIMDNCVDSLLTAWSYYGYINFDQVVSRVNKMNDDWKGVMFASNHVIPIAGIRKLTGFAEDLPVLQKMLSNSWILSKIVFRFDLDLKFDSEDQREKYNAQQKLRKKIIHKVYNWHPINKNTEERWNAMLENVWPVLNIARSLRKWNNILIDAWWARKENLSQDFSPEESFNVEEGRLFNLADWKEIQESWIKWFAKLAQIGKASVMPVFICRDKNWKMWFNFWTIIDPKNKQQIKVLEEYLEQMRRLKAETLEKIEI